MRVNKNNIEANPELSECINSARRYITMVTIAGSDSGAGAGIQADIKTAAALDVYAMTVVTAVTAQNSGEVKSIYPMSANAIREQLLAVDAECSSPDAVKIGMVPDPDGMMVIADFLENRSWNNIVVDPVLRSSSGTKFSTPEILEVFKHLLFPLSTLITPNIPEAETFTGIAIRSLDDMRDAASEILRLMILEKNHIGLAIDKKTECVENINVKKGVLVKGGHRIENDQCTDLLLYTEDGEVKERLFTHPYIDTPNSHGTGCTLSSAIASYLAKGLKLPKACDLGIGYLLEALGRGAHYQLGSSIRTGPLKHFCP